VNLNSTKRESRDLLVANYDIAGSLEAALAWQPELPVAA
jgi:hypothetical protein